MSNLVPVGVTSAGSLVAALAIGYGIRDKDAAAFAQRDLFKARQKTLLLAGKLSSQTTQSIQKAGRTVKTELRGGI